MVVRTWSNWNSYTLLAETQNVTATLKNGWAASNNVKHVLARPCHSTPRETIMYIHAKNVHSSSICKGNTGTTQRSTSRWLDKQVVIYPHSGIQLSNKKKRTTNTCNVDESQNADESQNRYAEWQKPDTKRLHAVRLYLYPTLENTHRTYSYRKQLPLPEARR